MSGGFGAHSGPSQDDLVGALPVVVDVPVLADGDEAGEAAAKSSALRWKDGGRRVRIARPPQGLDFNDMLPGRAPLTEESEQ